MFGDDLETAEKETCAHMFGHLFAKSIEYDYSQRHGLDRSQILDGYSLQDAVAGDLGLHLKPEVKDKLRIAFDYGKQFYKDLKVFCAMHEDSEFEEELFKALVIVQQIGEVYSKKILDAQLAALS